MKASAISILAILLLLAACSEQQAPEGSDQPRARDQAEQNQAAADSDSLPPIAEFFIEYTDAWVRQNPNQAVSSAYFSGEEQNRLEQQLTPLTLEYDLQRIERAREGLARLDRYDVAELSDTERVSAEVMRWQLEGIVEGEAYLDYDFPLQQMNGANVGLINQLTVVHPVRSAQNAENYVLRMRQLDERMQEATAEAARRSAAGIRPPRFILEATIEQMQRFVDDEPASNPLTTTLREKMAGVEELDDGRRAELLAEAEQIVAGEVYPAWEAAIAELQAQLPQSTDDAGLWRFEQGADIYAYHLKRYTTTNLTADQIHEIGLREVASIEAQMDDLLRQLGLTEGTVGERVEQLEQRLAYPDTDAGRESLMADIETYLRDAEARAEQYFDQRPRTPVIAQPYPRFRWENAAASYTSPPLDGSRPGVFQMPLRRDRLTNFGLRTLVYHETVPGHHFQIALATEDPELPRFMQIRAFGGSSATSEGWALYAERLASEAGWYEGDIEGQLGQLDAALFRARRLVVDTGLHAKQWTRQQAIDFGISPSEVDRYVVMPGQACSYMIGQLQIVALRDRMRQQLGDDFSIREFHNAALSLGVVPLTVLENEVEQRMQ